MEVHGILVMIQIDLNNMLFNGLINDNSAYVEFAEIIDQYLFCK